MESKQTLIIGIGNSGRKDDGLGWAFLETVKKNKAFDGELVYRYQLNVEDAEMISHVDRVIFVDAYKRKLPIGFQWKMILPEEQYAFTTHSFSPAALLFLCQELYSHTPEAYVLMIEGKNWGLGVGLSLAAKKNLKEAVRSFFSRY